MKKDLYTKIVLTVIAINLSVISFSTVFSVQEAKANQDNINVHLPEGMRYGLVPVNEDGSINVKLLDEIDVSITDIDTQDMLNINIKDSESYSLKYAGPLNVSVD